MNKNLIRIIPKLDIKNGLLIKGINLEGLRIIGDPYNFAKEYFDQGADEICYLDNVATLYGTNNLEKFISRTSKNIFIPMVVGGGIRSISDIEKFFKSGADKVCLNSKVIEDPRFLKKASKIFGSSNITVILESIKINDKYWITKSNGRDLVDINPVDWAKKVEDLGAGEIFLTSVNKEGLRNGFDINIAKKISKSVKLPVIVHGGAGNFNHIYDVIKKTNITGVSISSLFHYETCTNFNLPKISIGNIEFLKNYIKSKKKYNKKIIFELKKFLKNRNIKVRI